jgi:L-ascorbate metabolism protein UlaG (beta-lactamase superfamily)
MSGHSLSHLGQSGFRLCCGDAVVYIDPYLSDHVEIREGPAMRRLRDAPMPPAQVRDANWVLVSHIHADHCDPLTLGPIAEGNPSCRFLGPYEVTDFLASELGIERARLVTAGDEWVALSPGLQVLPIPAAHTAIEWNQQGLSRYVGFLMSVEARRLYHSGDCSVHPEIVSRLQQFGSIDLALLPVNECNYYRARAGIVGNMSIREAFGLAVEIRAAAVVPMHYDMFGPNCVYEEEIQAVYARLAPPFRLVMPDALRGI